MEGTVLNRELGAQPGSRIRFELATQRDDAEMRRLLRDNPMPGPVALSLEREPNYFTDVDFLGEEKRTVVAREHGRVVCVGSCATRWRFVGGQKRRVGYLGGLRLDKSLAGRFDILRRGYEFFREVQTDSSAELYFTSIASENTRARQFLERGIPGMPRYDFLGELVAVVLPVAGWKTIRRASEEHVCHPDEFCNALNAHNQHYDFAPCWSPRELSGLQSLGLARGDFQVIRNNGRIVAGAALWDQRAFKQAVVRGYSPWLSRLRLAMNLVARVTGRPRLPAVGAALAHAFVSHLVVAPDQPDLLVSLIRGLSSVAAQKNIELLTLGFAANDSRLATVRARFRCREYRSRIYAVRWPEMGVTELRRACFAPDAALL